MDATFPHAGAALQPTGEGLSSPLVLALRPGLF